MLNATIKQSLFVCSEWIAPATHHHKNHLSQEELIGYSKAVQQKEVSEKRKMLLSEWVWLRTFFRKLICSFKAKLSLSLLFILLQSLENQLGVEAAVNATGYLTVGYNSNNYNKYVVMLYYCNQLSLLPFRSIDSTAGSVMWYKLSGNNLEYYTVTTIFWMFLISVCVGKTTNYYDFFSF